MNKKSNIKKYGQSLYNVAIQKEELTDVNNRLDLIVEILESIPEFNQLFQSNQTTTENKLKILKNVLKDEITSLELELISDILDNSNISILPEISRYFKHLVEKNSSIINMTITSAVDLSVNEVDKIKSSVESKLNKKIDATTEIDTNLIGGIKLRIGNTLIDNSISRRLNLLKSKLTQA